VVHAQSPRLSRATRRSWTGFNCLDGGLRMPRCARNVRKASWFPVSLNELGELLGHVLIKFTMSALPPKADIAERQWEVR
jgi:hypothetical protein